MPILQRQKNEYKSILIAANLTIVMRLFYDDSLTCEKDEISTLMQHLMKLSEKNTSLLVGDHQPDTF
jgi:hypothetical protein